MSYSIRKRLSWSLSLSIVLVATISGGLSYVGARIKANDRQDDTLRQVAQLVRLQTPDMLSVREAGNDDDTTDYHIGIEPINPPPNWPASHEQRQWPSNLSPGMHSVQLDDDNYQVMVTPVKGGALFAVFQETDIRKHIANASAWRAIVPLLILIPILLLVVNDLLRRLLAPINELSQAVNQRDNDDTSALPLLLLPTEVQPVVLATNRLLSRLGESMQAQRRFIADAAHELRTPMTALSLQAQRLEAIALPADARVRLQALLTGITRTRHLLDQLLNLARIQNAMPASANKSASAAPLTTPVKASFTRVLENTLNGARTKQIDLGVSDAPADEVNVRANEDNLDSIVRNLVDNAIRYTPKGGQIDVSLRIEHAHAIISVQDSGPGIEPSERLRVLDPFYRVLGTEQLGTGLGLAIVSTLLQQLNGSLVLIDRADGGTGLLAQVRLPLAH